MSEADTNDREKLAAGRKARLAKRLDVAGWGLFFIWVAIALLTDVGWGIGLLGVGIITLGEQVVRKCVGLRPEWFWIVAGLLFVVGGVWRLLEIELQLVPILLIVAGAALLVSAVWGKHHKTGG